jgi:hypothetical protein
MGQTVKWWKIQCHFKKLKILLVYKFNANFLFYLSCQLSTLFPFDVFPSRHFLLIDVLSMLAFFPVDVISNRRFFYFSTFCPSRQFLPSTIFSVDVFLLFDLLSQSMFFSIRRFISFGVFSFDVLSVDIFLPSVFFTSALCRWIQEHWLIAHLLPIQLLFFSSTDQSPNILGNEAVCQMVLFSENYW